MCGIFGVALLQGHKISDPKILKIVLRRLFEESKKRGTDASGIAFATDEHISVIKHNIDASRFIKAKFYEEAERVHIDKNFKNLRIMIGHTRSRTKGTPTDRNNNHPVVANRVIGVHNGNISNDDELFDEYTSQFPDNFERRGRVDTEIIFRLLDHYRHTVRLQMYDTILTTNGLIRGSYACAFVDAGEPWMLYLFKGWSPTDINYYPEYGLLIFASSRVFIYSATKGFNFGSAVSIGYEKESCMSINTISNKTNVFDLKREGTFA